MEVSETANIPSIDSLPNRPPEIPRNAFVPMLLLKDVKHPEQPIPTEIQNEAQRAALSTMLMLGIDISKYRQGVIIGNLVDLETTNAERKLTLPRKPGTDASVLVIVLSANPLYNNGQEVGSYVTEDNKIMINLHNIDQYILNKVPTATKVGLSVIEETIHQIQINHWGRPKEYNMDSVSDIKKHRQHPIESEMYPYLVKIGQSLCPSEVKNRF